MRDGFAIAGDDFALRAALHEVIARRNRLRRCRRDAVGSRRDVRASWIKAMGHGSSRDDMNGERSGVARHRWRIAFKWSMVASR